MVRSPKGLTGKYAGLELVCKIASGFILGYLSKNGNCNAVRAIDLASDIARHLERRAARPAFVAGNRGEIYRLDPDQEFTEPCPMGLRSGGAFDA